MPDPDNSRTGIELDLIDIRAVNADEQSEKAAAPANESPIDSDTFIQSVLKKMSRDDSFLSFSEQVGDVNKILKMKYSSAKDISGVIVKDTALTAKLLKLVNSSFYGQFSEQGITTISEAMIILGTEVIKLAAASLKLYEMMQSKATKQVLKEKTLKGLQRSLIARQVGLDVGYGNAEELQVSAMLYDFGEYLVALFEPDVYQQVRQHMNTRRVSKEDASYAVIGIKYSELARLIGSKWNFPPAIINALQPAPRSITKEEAASPEMLRRFICSFSDDIVNINTQDGSVGRELSRISEFYRHILGISPSKAADLMKTSWEKIVRHASVLRIDTNTDPSSQPAVNVQDVESGIASIGSLMDTSFSIHEVLTRIVDDIWKNFDFSKVCVCIKNKPMQTMEARFVRADDTDFFTRHFKFKIGRMGDLFNHALHNNTPVVIEHLAVNPKGYEIPLWYIDKQFATAFGVFPIVINGKIVAMLYLDWDPDRYSLNGDTFTLMEKYRDLIIRAMRKKR
ncbi:MAG: GAF domain-containing protein [Desulfobacteraceae bacterium]|nr:MAG: GAF domain-containing protein [Desulfobacteraceae bacterium]